MGRMQFLVSAAHRPAEPAVEAAYFSGIDGVPWLSENQWTEQGLEIRRAENDSGLLSILWPVPGLGMRTLSTGSLMERERPYRLGLELARGTIHRIRNQIAEWTASGFVVPPEIPAQLTAAQSRLAGAAIAQNDPELSDKEAADAIRIGCELIESLAAGVAEQALAARHRQMPKFATLFGVDLGSVPLDETTGRRVAEGFNTGQISLAWRDIEARDGDCQWQRADQQIAWCQANHLKICSSPLVRFDDGGVPDWLYLWEDDFDQVMTLTERYVESVVKRYVGKVNLWQCAARINVGKVLALTEEQRLRLAVHTIEVTRSIDERAPVIIAFDQPWAEYMAHQSQDLPGLHFADALARAQLGLAGIALEINLGYSPGGTLPRDAMDMSRQIDQWSQFGLPLVVSLTIPSGSHDDPLASGKDRRPIEWVEGGATPESQRAWADSILSMLLTKTSVQGILWGQLRDDQPHEFPHGGLFDAQGAAKPALERLAALRRQHLT